MFRILRLTRSKYRRFKYQGYAKMPAGGCDTGALSACNLCTELFLWIECKCSRIKTCECDLETSYSITRIARGMRKTWLDIDIPASASKAVYVIRKCAKFFGTNLPKFELTCLPTSLYVKVPSEVYSNVNWVHISKETSPLCRVDITLNILNSIYSF